MGKVLDVITPDEYQVIKTDSRKEYHIMIGPGILFYIEIDGSLSEYQNETQELVMLSIVGGMVTLSSEAE